MTHYWPIKSKCVRLRTSLSIGKSFPSKARHIFLRRKIAQCTKQVPDSPCNVMYFFTCISSEKSHVFDAALRRVVIFSTKAHYMLVYMIWHMPRPPACFWSTNPRNNVLRIDMFWAKAKTAIIGWSPPLYHFRSQWTHPSFATGLKPIICLFSNEKKGPLKNAFLGLLFQIESGQFKRHETLNDAFCQTNYQKVNFEHGRIRTCNLLIRSQTRYPLRHAPDP